MTKKCDSCDTQSGTARDASTEEFQFEEPMVFDLVRGLGSKPGEMEANYLMIVPLNNDPVLISPEFEFVYSTHQVSILQTFYFILLYFQAKF